MAQHALRALGDQSIERGTVTRESASKEALGHKTVAETALLLVCAQPIRGLDRHLSARLHELALSLMPLARSSDVASAICSDPGRALDYAFAHVLLTQLGYPDQSFDVLVREALSVGFEFGPDRAPDEWLKRLWLSGLMGVEQPPARHRRVLRESLLGRPLDVLGTTRFDMYAFTHTVMYASHMGERRVRLTRPHRTVVADADAALAFSLDADDLDLTAELAMTLPLLGLAWSPAATFAFRVLADAEQELGFLPGLQFDRKEYESLEEDERRQHAVQSSYHSGYVMGFLCAVAARQGCAPPTEIALATRWRGAGAAIAKLLVGGAATPLWLRAFNALDARQQDSLAHFALTSVFRRARVNGDLPLIREGLQLALSHNLEDAPAVHQAVALLRRATLGASLVQRHAGLAHH